MDESCNVSLVCLKPVEMAENNKASEWSISLVAFSSCSVCCDISSVCLCCIRSVLFFFFTCTLLSFEMHFHLFLKHLIFIPEVCFTIMYSFSHPVFSVLHAVLITSTMSYLPSYQLHWLTSKQLACTKGFFWLTSLPWAQNIFIKTELSLQIQVKLNERVSIFHSSVSTWFK